MNDQRNCPFESDRGPVVLLTIKQAQALEWVADAGIEQLIAENNSSGLSLDVKRDLGNASDGIGLLQRSIKEFLSASALKGKP